MPFFGGVFNDEVTHFKETTCVLLWAASVSIEVLLTLPQ